MSLRYLCTILYEVHTGRRLCHPRNDRGKVCLCLFLLIFLRCTIESRDRKIEEQQREIQYHITDTQFFNHVSNKAN